MIAAANATMVRLLLWVLVYTWAQDDMYSLADNLGLHATLLLMAPCVRDSTLLKWPGG